MRILRASDMGMCFGVRDALQIAQQISNPTQVTIHGELVHNPVVNERLAQAGFRQLAEDSRAKPAPTPLVLITAHGVSEAERRRLEDAGKRLIDTTCPLVRRVHEAALELEAEGRHVLLIGKEGHVEVQGVIEDLRCCDVVERVESVRCYQKSHLGIVCQTTMPPDLVTEICTYIQLHNPLADIRLIDTVCDPTRRRQRAMLELLAKVEAVVVVGGRNSNNTRRLVELCQQHAIPSCHVEGAEDLEAEWLEDFETVGLTAGTSTLDETIEAVERALWRIGAERQERVTE